MVRILLRYWLLAALLAIVGLTLRTMGDLTQRTAASQRRVLTLDLEASAADAATASAATPTGLVGSLTSSGALAPVAGAAGLAGDSRASRATALYWQRQYGELALKTSATGEVLERDPAVLLTAANAAYRRASADETGPNAVAAVEAVVGQYADVLRRGTWQFDAAYNYEFATRRRDALIKARSARPAERRELPKPPATTTLHGQAGSVPPGTDMSDFKIVVPQRSDERREQPEAGKGGPKQRKG